MSAIEQGLSVKTNAGETVIVADCACGKLHQVSGVKHYDRYSLKCGRLVWALQPKRNGPLKLFTWPGPPMTGKELAAKEAAAREQQIKDIRFNA